MASSELSASSTSTPRLERERAILAAAFELRHSDIASDAQLVRASSERRDELLVSICRAHGWRAELGVIYLAHLIRHVDRAAGPLPAAWASG